MTRNLVSMSAGLALLYLFLPVLVVAAFSFNDNAGRFNVTWQGFTLRSWLDPCAVPELCSAVLRSVEIGLLAALVATVIGTLLAFALVRWRFFGRTPTTLVLFLVLSAPEVVLGSSLLALFLNVGARRGLVTIVVAHVLFAVSFVVVIVKARLHSLDARLEEAAMDLYADEITTLRTVTLPLALPGIVAGGLLAFALSFDDFVITNFNAGDTVTFPLFVWGAAQRGVPPQVNVVGTAVFAVFAGLAVAGQLLWGRSQGRAEPGPRLVRGRRRTAAAIRRAGADTSRSARSRA